MLRGPRAAGLRPLAWEIGAGAEKLGLQGVPASRREAGLCPAARCSPRSCAGRQESGDPPPLFLKSGCWEPAPGLLATPVPWRCGQRDSSGVLPMSSLGGHLRGREAGAECFPGSHPSRVGEDREGTPQMLCPQLCSRAAAEACTPVLLACLLRPSPGSGSKIPKQGKKEKARGRGRCRLQRPPSPPSCGKTAALLLAERGCEGGPGSPRGLPLTAPRASSRGGCCTAGGAGGGSPRGCTTCGKGWMLVR